MECSGVVEWQHGHAQIPNVVNGGCQTRGAGIELDASAQYIGVRGYWPDGMMRTGLHHQ